MKKAPSQRQLKVGELIRSALSRLFLREELAGLGNVSITVSEVRISPDLKNATAYIFPLGGNRSEEIVKELRNYEGLVRRYISKEVQLRYAPRISFKLDNSFEHAARINDLLNSSALADA